MKTLFLVRHAKSSWEDPNLADKDRPLSPRGRRAARKMGRRLARRRVDPDVLITSPAERARRTARILARRLDYPRRRILVDRRLYACAPETLLRAIRALADSVETVMLVGHNPEMTVFAHGFCAQITHMPTCGIARLRFEIDSWAQAGVTTPVETELMTPKRRNRGRT